MKPPGLSRRALLALGFGACLATVTRSASAVVVPISLQVQLLAKVASYDRNLATRAGGNFVTLIVKKDGDPESTSSADHALHAFGGIDRVAGLPHSEAVIAYEGASALLAACTSKRASLVFLMPGLSNEIDAVREALAKASLITASAVPTDVPKGVVIGVDQVSGKPKLLVNLPVALQQRVDFSGELLRIATVIR